MRPTAIICTHPIKICGTCTFGYNIDGTADSTGWRHTVQQSIRTFNDFDPLSHARLNTVCRRNTVCAIKRHFAGIEQIHPKSTDLIGIKIGCFGIRCPYRRIVLQDIRDGFGLLVGDLLAGVTRDADRRIHDVGIAQHAKATTRCHLAACIGRRKICLRVSRFNQHRIGNRVVTLAALRCRVGQYQRIFACFAVFQSRPAQQNVNGGRNRHIAIDNACPFNLGQIN